MPLRNSTNPFVVIVVRFFAFAAGAILLDRALRKWL